ncbi:MAG TPA: gfo/Idh/MocA family oxidoreductase [Rhodopirellula baltica]|uniref:Probable NADH-dependent dyhydrogenase n=1 Tax=Rhodopirellula baltica (strain DSM 10527 / NCIMB 13988 / SH1) TaxID=243090 RepID=Q7UKS7_RHOBA|nr:Gfo/Idh/MocA family oxidoreductase [Rhodopirellula baltica]CAD76555.1 probable NADH-dependent dyhydrogenase [Rhodopirellula baltica SH 1]HBE65923.1 gfo/Idh/MocA family oxidoreductase [Rhodopirellula baltica]
MNQNPSKRETATTNRRTVLKAVAGAAAMTPYFAWSPRSLADEIANDKINIGLIGAGGMGRGNLNSAKQWLNLVAIADADSSRAQQANDQFSDGKAAMHSDYRKVLERDDIKVVHIATPDHWHTKPLIEALYAGKDVYCEKPMTLTIDEGKLIRKVQKETGRIVQVGTQQRSTFDKFVKAMAIVNEGRLGKIHRVQAAIGGAPTSEALPVASPPEALDWDLWLGPAPKVDYRRSENGKQSNGHYEFRWWYEYSGGKLTDWGAHHVDICNWALKLNGQTEGPVSIGGSAQHPVEYKDGKPVQIDRYNTATAFQFNVAYPGGTEMIIRNDTRNGVLIEGEKGRIFVSRGNLSGKPVEDLADNPLPEDAISKVYKGLPVEHNERRAHWFNFLHCHREGLEPISDVHTHMEMLNVCHLAGISARLGRDLKWDNESEQIVGDDQANSMLARPYREGYEIEMG